MKKITLTVIAASLAFSLPVNAEEAHHPDQVAAATTVSAPQVGKMQENVKKMRSQLDRIAKAKTDSERQKAMADHMQTMQENMQMAHGMKSCPMMEGGMMGKGGQGMMGQGMASDGMMTKRMDMMEKRMDMMQMMMQGRMGAPEAVVPAKPTN